MLSNFCFLVQAEFSLVIGGNCNASHFLATGRLPLSSEGQQWTNRWSLASFYDILLWCLVCSTLVKNYSRHDWRRISTKDVTAPFQVFKVFNNIQTLVFLVPSFCMMFRHFFNVISSCNAASCKPSVIDRCFGVENFNHLCLQIP